MDMDLKSSSPSTGLPPPNCVSDPEEKEISDGDDDDRNHKHRRRETRSQSLDRDPVEQTLTQLYRKRNRQFENGQSDPQSQYNSNRDFSKLEKRRPIAAHFSRSSGELGSGGGRGRDYQHNSRFGAVGFASQISHPGSIPLAMFSGRGLSNVSNAQSASWGGFGLIPAIPNGAMDAINPFVLPGILRPQLNPPLNIGIQRQRCRDFEERGFCLRGDMCPMEHGVNRIVVEDVQSLSQFNLPVSLSSAHVLGSSPGSGLAPSIGASSSALINSRGLYNIISKSAADDAVNFDGTFSGGVNASGSDVYDPDQLLWNNDGHETSTPLLGMQPRNFDEPEELLHADLSDRIVRCSGAAVGAQSTSSLVWGRLNNSKHKLGLKEKFDTMPKPSEYSESSSKEICEALGSTQRTSHLGKKNNGVTFDTKNAGSTSKLQNDIGYSVRKPTQKAQRTLFVNGIPMKDNKKENLFSHFRKFGEVIDIYIPANSERAFVQFSKREEAERALKAPDAVMGSRFIKLWWANRDSIVDDGMSSGNHVSATLREIPAASALPHSAFFNKENDNLQYPTSKMIVSKVPENIVTAGSDSKPVTSKGPKEPQPVQKKMESLELLREELRKKQEMLEQRRNEFRQQLDKLAKQAPGGKSELHAGQAAKRQKVETSADIAGSAQSADVIISRSSSQSEVLLEKTVNIDSSTCQRYKGNSTAVLQDPLILKQTLRTTATFGTPFHINRYKLDNRPKSFKINAPLPNGLASAAALRDHFSLFGDISNVEIEELGKEDNQDAPNDSEVMRNCSACISFVTRHSAERAFMSGKSWHGHNLQFTWVTPSIPCSIWSSGESSSALRGALTVEVQSANKTRDINCHETSGPAESNLSPAKPLNGEEHSVSEAHLPDKSAGYVPLEGDEPESKDSEMPEEVGGDDMQPDEELQVCPTPLAE